MIVIKVVAEACVPREPLPPFKSSAVATDIAPAGDAGC